MNFPLESFLAVSLQLLDLRLRIDRICVWVYLEMSGFAIRKLAMQFYFRHDRAQGHVHRHCRGHGSAVRHGGIRRAQFRPGVGQPDLHLLRDRRRLDHGSRLHHRRVLPDHLTGIRFHGQDRRYVLHAGRLFWRLLLARSRNISPTGTTTPAIMGGSHSTRYSASWLAGSFLVSC